jgi:aryl-alcohol dehydrogenase-like predicted oxidoreductase
MKTRTLGRTGLPIPELVLGAGWVGGIMIHSDEETRHKAVETVLDAGSDWIDTAADYGQGESEKTLGRVLKALPEARRPQISTKFRLDLESGEDLEAQLRRSIETSLTRLGLSKVPLLQLHNPVQPHRSGQMIGLGEVVGKGGVADLLDKVRADGLCDHIGFTALGHPASVIKVVESGRMDTAQVYYNLLNPTAGLARAGGLKVQDFSGLLGACRRQNVGVFNIRVFAAGVLVTDQRHGREIPITTEADMGQEARRAEAIHAVLGDDLGSKAQRAIRFALAHPDVSTVVFGAAEPTHMTDALAAAKLGPLPQDALTRVQAVWDRNFGL